MAPSAASWRLSSAATMWAAIFHSMVECLEIRDVGGLGQGPREVSINDQDSQNRVRRKLTARREKTNAKNERPRVFEETKVKSKDKKREDAELRSGDDRNGGGKQPAAVDMQQDGFMPTDRLGWAGDCLPLATVGRWVQGFALRGNTRPMGQARLVPSAETSLIQVVGCFSVGALGCVSW